MSSILRISIITNIIPIYREGFYDRLLENKDCNVRIYCQDKIPGTDFKTIHSKYKNSVRLIKHISAKEERVVFQFLPWMEIINNSDVIFIDGNPRVISNFLFASYLRLRKKKIVLWTMGHAFSANSITESIRLYWSKFFNYIFVYTDKEVVYLKKKGFLNNVIVGMNNGLDQKKIDTISKKWNKKLLNEWLNRNYLNNNVLLLSCARLIEKNKFDLFLDAMPQIIKNIPNVKWCLIGDGNEREKLENKARYLGIEKHIKFVGKLVNENELAPWFLTSKLFIHPAAIGLSLMHAFGYGLPVITHQHEELHGPEYAAFTKGKTGEVYQYNDRNSLSEVVTKLLESEDKLKEMRETVLSIARKCYNTDVMVMRFLEIANLCMNKETF